MTTAQPVTRPARPDRPQTYFRTNRSLVVPELVSVEPSGGKFRAGLLRNVAVITAGEALGHEMWIDSVTLEQVVEFSRRGNNGVKSRFTHPGMSADGLGRHLGRVREMSVDTEDGTRVLGDLHFQRSAHSTPEGNLAQYVMDLADEDPNAAGLSIVFEHDWDAELDFMLEHGGQLRDGGMLDLSNFESPDPLNTNNFPHVRLSELRAADVVDEPAANPDGLFDRQSLARDVDMFMSYVAGLNDDKPNTALFGIDPDRAVVFFDRWLVQHQLQLVSKETEMATDDQTPDNTPDPQPTPQPTPAPEPTPANSRDEVTAELSRFTAKFGPENGAKWFTAGDSYEQALEKQVQLQADRITELETELAAAKDKADNVSLGEADPVDTKPGDANSKSFKSLFKFQQAAPASAN